jgi:hypothetical protein
VLLSLSTTLKVDSYNFLKITNYASRSSTETGSMAVGFRSVILTMSKMSVIHSRLKEEQFRCNCTAVSLHFRIVLIKIKTLILSWDELLHSALTEVHILCYQQSRHDDCHAVIISIFLAAKISLEHWKQSIIARL